MENLVTLSIEEMTGLNYMCSCGKNHSVGIETIKVGSGVINNLPTVIKNYEGMQVFIIEDTHTYEVAGKKVEELLKEKFKVSKYIFNEKHLHPNELTLGRLVLEIPVETDLVIAVGSGTINDISRFLGCKLGIPYVIVGTAPSMDGYASVVSPLICDGVKVTYDGVYPLAIVCDIDIMKEAPMLMLQAGLGDILGKYTALADWHVAKIINKEYFCPEVEKLVLSTLKKCEEAAAGVTSRDASTVQNITEALILSGIAIGMVGASRPASGGEHYLSHCYEMMFMNNGDNTKWLHGNTVGVGVGVVAYAFKFAKDLDIDEIFKKGDYVHLDKNTWKQNIMDVFTISAPNIIEFKQGSINFNEEERKTSMEKIRSNWDDIKKVCESCVPEPTEIIKTLKKAGAVWDPKELGLSKELFRKSFIAAKDMRNRYGIMQLLEDVGKLDEASDYITNIYYK
ncbi:sn-glycerol-1-phosphate dehydrogenase [Clostridium estertheticum]|uniref:Glycerol-1-phosphate dehydrogenase n=1 Tax=Clostridium estertheticum subsp. estertheticum TaxID=1552 RepID=A0A1J0GFG7_9CLOT|nr:sn-glycerol-1-phosphate dehydrogenase [Clostridium estertheticum]APC40124.1 glycerol-1-phosphate dehydrogenase [Clostridium estertheticum subsp. estertheticum]MBU3072361.1 sn-glycerol-1-phosphate dehydrogenase [Clostridium estertheticum]MBU3162454.1 sn-glycerol-1-phosphate dehydrogenase [Clostridium estertheticum]MBU3170343.1 sn-glycerol-1-phosphate dehydrogenase [Clostridium estertheticum]MBZ9618093.1 sn-glycerol-1-phosphate dehydrogenase [Clostridium estertheticum subsp. laramiense]